MAYIIQGVRDSSRQIGQRSQRIHGPHTPPCVSTLHHVSESFPQALFCPLPYMDIHDAYIHIYILYSQGWLLKSLLTSIAPHHFLLLSLHVYVCNEKCIWSLASKGFPFVVKRSEPHSLQYTSLARSLGIFCIISFLKSHLEAHINPPSLQSLSHLETFLNVYHFVFN